MRSGTLKEKNGAQYNWGIVLKDSTALTAHQDACAIPKLTPYHSACLQSQFGTKRHFPTTPVRYLTANPVIAND